MDAVRLSLFKLALLIRNGLTETDFYTPFGKARWWMFLIPLLGQLMLVGYIFLCALRLQINAIIAAAFIILAYLSGAPPVLEPGGGFNLMAALMYAVILVNTAVLLFYPKQDLPLYDDERVVAVARDVMPILVVPFVFAYRSLPRQP